MYITVSCLLYLYWGSQQKCIHTVQCTAGLYWPTYQLYFSPPICIYLYSTTYNSLVYMRYYYYNLCCFSSHSFILCVTNLLCFLKFSKNFNIYKLHDHLHSKKIENRFDKLCLIWFTTHYMIDSIPVLQCLMEKKHKNIS